MANQAQRVHTLLSEGYAGRPVDKRKARRVNYIVLEQLRAVCAESNIYPPSYAAAVRKTLQLARLGIVGGAA